MSPLESEDVSPIYASPPHSPLSDINSPCEEIKSQPNADMHFARDTHMRIILGNARFDSGGHLGWVRILLQITIAIVIYNKLKLINYVPFDENFFYFHSSKPKRNGIVTNPALRLMSNVKNGLECAAERIQKTRQEVSKFNHSKLNSSNKSNGYHWKKETPL